MAHVGDTREVGAPETLATLSAAASAYAEGDAARALAHCRRVVELTDRPEDLAASALLVHGVSGEVNGLVVGLCDKVLARIPETEPALRARVDAQRAHAIGELLLGSAATEISSQALARAEESGDAPAISRALQAWHQALSAPDLTSERIRLADRMVALADTTGDLDAELWGRLWRIDAAFELGEPSVLQGQVARLGLIASRTGGALADWHAQRLRASVALLSGDFEIAEQATERARNAARRTREPVHLLLLEILDFERCRLTGGPLADDVKRARAFALGFGQLPIAWSNGGIFLLNAGDIDLARTCYERLRPVLRELPRDGRWLYTVLAAAELAIAFEDTVTVGWCHATLMPYADQYVAGAGGTIACLGSVAGTLGRLVAADSDLNLAAVYFAQSANANERIGAAPYQVLDELELARVLLQRAHPGDLPTARDLAARAGDAARRLGMTSFRAQAVELAAAAHRVATEHVGLTRRERDILARLARGASNRSMAATLVVSERTVETHVANILAKLGVANRTEAATWALRNGLGNPGGEAR